MADPMTSLFGKRAFRGTGRTQDYFPEAPDLDFLQRPTFMAPGAGYNPKLDPASLVSAGFSPRNAMVLQGFRQQLHEQAGAEREFEDTRRALDGLATLDPTRKTFSKELLDIFRKNPTSMRNPEVLQRAEFISKFAGQPQWSVEDIEDPDIYQQAVKEGWGNLSPQEAKRRANSLITQRTIRGELAALGMPKTDLDKVQNWTQEDYLREKGRLVREAKGATAKPWYERLGKTAAEDVRTVAKETKALADFEDEYAKVLADNPGLTKDAYVKQFKGDPDFNSYRTRRLAEAIPSLVQEYSLTPQEAAQVLGLGGMIPQATTATDPFADRTTFGPAAQEAPTVAPQSSPGASSPVPGAPISQADLKRLELAPTAPKTDTGFNFPTLGDDMPEGPVTSAIKATKQAASNLASNIKFDPMQALAQATSPGGVTQMAAIPAPTAEQQNKEWTAAKQKVRDFIASIPGDDQQKLKILGSLVSEQSIPHDFFTKKKATEGDRAFVPAGSALEEALREMDPKLRSTALKDKDGVKRWKDIAKVVAQEEMAQRGLINASAGDPQAANVAKVTSRAQYDALPSGTPYTDSNGRRAVKK